jgi:carbon monoxide dehydrogenase subunit G
MFTIRAKCTDLIEVNTGIETARDFFADIKNFADLMPGVESIYTDAKGITHWKINVQVPFVGDFSQKFAVEVAEHSEERIEWMPIIGETRNFLRYAADFFEKSANRTLVNYMQMVEIRRQSAKDLHLLAGVAGESIISGEMSKHIAQMIKIFINKAKERLER